MFWRFLVTFLKDLNAERYFVQPPPPHFWPSTARINATNYKNKPGRRLVKKKDPLISPTSSSVLVESLLSPSFFDALLIPTLYEGWGEHILMGSFIFCFFHFFILDIVLSVQYPSRSFHQIATSTLILVRFSTNFKRIETLSKWFWNNDPLLEYHFSSKGILESKQFVRR